MIKRRIGYRVVAYMAAKIVAPGQISPAPCLVQDLSEMGAKLRVADGWIIPRTFWLRIEGDPRLHHCTVVWRDGQSAGVKFPQGCDSTWWQHSRTALHRQLPTRART